MVRLPRYHIANGYEQEIGRQNIGSCGVARSIIVGFHPADPGSNPGTSTKDELRSESPRSLYL